MKFLRALVSLICLSLCFDMPHTHAQTAAEYVNRGLAQQKAGDLDAAIAAYDRAITLNPRVNPAAYYNRAVIRNEKGNFTGAIADLNQAIALRPNYAIAHFARGMLKADNKLDQKPALPRESATSKSRP
jgi:tetratricopeptide (TPR) repeat protein